MDLCIFALLYLNKYINRNMWKLNKFVPLYIIVFSIFLILIGKTLFSDGMFMDGLLYASVAKNLSNGIGSFWHLHLTNTFLPQFYEHPPLAFGLQSLFFYVFGESIYIERIYSLLTFVIVGILIVSIWNIINNEKQTGWLPLLFWITIPLVSWCCSNNMLENTMSVFICLSMLFYLKYINNNKIIYLILIGLMLFLGFLTKGFTALFPISLPFWYWLINRKGTFLKMLFELFNITTFTVLPIALLLIIYPSAREFLMQYFKIQVLNSLNDVVTVESRFFILKKMFLELIPILIISTILIIVNWKRKNNLMLSFNNFYFFLFIGLSGVLPIMISMKQNGFYILTTFPFFAIAFCSLVFPFVKPVTDKINTFFSKNIYLKILPFIVLFAAIVYAFSYKGSISRDEIKINDAYKILKIVPKGSSVSICKSMWNDWGLHGYYCRFGNVSLDASNSPHQFKIILNNCEAIDNNQFIIVPINTKRYKLYKRK